MPARRPKAGEEELARRVLGKRRGRPRKSARTRPKSESAPSLTSEDAQELDSAPPAASTGRREFESAPVDEVPGAGTAPQEIGEAPNQASTAVEEIAGGPSEACTTLEKISEALCKPCTEPSQDEEVASFQEDTPRSNAPAAAPDGRGALQSLDKAAAVGLEGTTRREPTTAKEGSRPELIAPLLARNRWTAGGALPFHQGLPSRPTQRRYLEDTLVGSRAFRQRASGPAGSNGIFNAFYLWLESADVTLVVMTNRAEHRPEVVRGVLQILARYEGVIPE